MSSVDTTRAPYDSDDQDGNNLFFCILIFLIYLAYRQQIREKSQPVCFGKYLIIN